MTLDPALGRADRIGSFVIGVGLGTFAAAGDIGQLWLRIVLVIIGVAFIIGGVGGT